MVAMIKRVVVAADKFKGSLTAAEVAARLAAGLARAGFDGEVVSVPVADGGDGTVDAAVAAGYERVQVPVSGPTGLPVTASFALHRIDHGRGVAVIEAAQACGLVLLPGNEPAPLTATTWGVGELIRAAADHGATRIVLGVGGSASTDGGAGMVQALGARLTDDVGRELPPGGAALARLASLDLSGMTDLSGITFEVASDVDNPLLGPEGAAAVYGPQKGASPQDVTTLDVALTRWADVVEGSAAAQGAAAPDTPTRDTVTRNAAGAGAAGGLGFAAMAFLGARLRPGIELLLELASFDAALEGADLVITGEGALDEQTLRGKAPVGVARAVAAHNPALPVIAVAGRQTLTAEQLHGARITAGYALTDLEPDIARCIANAGPLLEQLADRVAKEWLGARE
jgi:glycerate 2-kinase